MSLSSGTSTRWPAPTPNYDDPAVWRENFEVARKVWRADEFEDDVDAAGYQLTDLGDEVHVVDRGGAERFDELAPFVGTGHPYRP